MNYAIEVLRKEFALLENGIKTWPERNQVEYADRWKVLTKKRDQVAQAIEVLKGSSQLTIFDQGA